MPAPTYRGISSANITGTTSATFTQPAGSAQGDLQFIVFEATDSTTTGATPNVPTADGWQQIFLQTFAAGTAGQTSTLVVFARVAPASPADQLVDGVGDHLTGRMLGIEVGTHNVVDVTTDIVVGTAADHGVGTTGLSTPSIATTQNSLVLWIMGLSDDASDATNASAQTNANLADITERWDNTATTGAGGGVSVATATVAGTSTGAGTWNHDTGVQSESVYLAVPPAIPVAAASLSADADITAAGVKVIEEFERSSALDAVADVLAVGAHEVPRAAALDASADIVSAGESETPSVYPYKVTGLVATAVSTTEIELTWDDVVALTGEVFDIERDGVVILEDYAGPHAVGDPYSDTDGLSAETEYTYRVRAVGGVPA